MSNTTRRQFIQSTGIATGAAAVAPMLWTSKAHAQWTNVPEKDAKLRVLRWSRFVQGDIDAYMVEHDLPRHPLVEQGFASIGCWPCTKAAEGREGRWSNVEDKTECGIHLPHEMAEAEMVAAG